MKCDIFSGPYSVIEGIFNLKLLVGPKAYAFTPKKVSHIYVEPTNEFKYCTRAKMWGWYALVKEDLFALHQGGILRHVWNWL